MRVINLALKDLTQVFRDRKSALFFLAMPLVFTLFFGSVFSGEGEDDPRLPVGVLIQAEEGALVGSLQSLLESSDTIRPVLLKDADETSVAESVGNQDLAAAMVVPVGFSDRVWSGEPPPLTVITDLASQAGQAARDAIETTVFRLLSAAETARLSADLSGMGGDWRYREAALALALDSWQHPPLVVEIEMSGTAEAGEPLPSGYDQASPGMMVQFAMFGVMQSAIVLVLERKSGALRRLLTTPIRKWEVIIGHVLAMFITGLIQMALLVIFGQWALGVDYLREPLAILVMTLALSLWVAGLGLLISVVSRTEDQAVMWSIVVMMALSALGGAWFPLDITGNAFSTVGRLTPAAWAMSGLQNIVLRGLGVHSVLLPAAVLLAYATVFLALAVWRFRTE